MIPMRLDERATGERRQIGYEETHMRTLVMDDASPTQVAEKVLRRVRRRLRVVLAGGGLASAMLISACGSGSTSSNASPSNTNSAASGGLDAAAHNMLPASIKQSGVIHDGSGLDFPPYDLTSADGTPQGIDVDLAHALEPVLGVKFVWVHQGFASLIPSVQSGRLDVGWESMAILPSRLQSVSFVRYLVLQNGLVVKAGNPTNVSTQDVCGHTIGLEAGAEEIQLYQQKNADCTAAGKTAIKTQVFPSEATQILAVESGQVEAAGVGYATAAYIAQTSNGKLAAAPGGPVSGGDVDAGIAINKSNTQLGNALVAALKDIKANGAYQKVLQKWGVSQSGADFTLVAS